MVFDPIQYITKEVLSKSTIAIIYANGLEHCSAGVHKGKLDIDTQKATNAIAVLNDRTASHDIGFMNPRNL